MFELETVEGRQAAREALSVAMARFGMFKPEAEDWLFEQVLPGLDGDAGLPLRIRKAGEPLTAQEKRDIGLRANAHMGRGFRDSLTEAGLQDPVRAAELLVQNTRTPLFARAKLKQAERLGLRVKYKVMAEGCAAALKMKNKSFDPVDAPSMPLPSCDKGYCLCMLQPQVDSKAFKTKPATQRTTPVKRTPSRFKKFLRYGLIAFGLIVLARAFLR